MTKPFYTNLDRIDRYLSLSSSNETDDKQLMSHIGRASRSIDKYCRREFYPLRETRFYDYREAREIRLDKDLLSLETLKTMNGASTIASPTMILQNGDNYNRPPWDKIVLRYNTGSLFLFSGTDQRANEVTGWWGYHEDYGNAWVDTGASLGASYSASAGSLTLSGTSYGVGASDANFESPRIAPGDTLMIEGEMMFVAGGNGVSQVNLIPYQNGTSANNHPSGAKIYRFSPEPDIQWATERLAAWLYGQAMTPYEVKTANVMLGTLSIPEGMAADVRQRLDRFVRMSIVVYPNSPTIRDRATVLVK
jgi:hypothetical protein